MITMNTASAMTTGYRTLTCFLASYFPISKTVQNGDIKKINIVYTYMFGISTGPGNA